MVEAAGVDPVDLCIIYNEIRILKIRGDACGIRKEIQYIPKQHIITYFE